MTKNTHAERILILDFGSQTTQLIARKVREAGVYCEIFPYDASPKQIKQFDPRGVILSGSPETVTFDSTPRAPQIIFELGCPLLGICYGMQTMALQLGGKVESHHHKELGPAKIRIHQPKSRLWQNLSDGVLPDGDFYLDVWMNHGDRVSELPPGFDKIGSTNDTPFAAVENKARQHYAVQFHPEVSHTKKGMNIISNFVLDICKCSPSWTPSNIVTDLQKRIKDKIGQDQVILGLSGGVDSTVVAALLHQTIGQQLVCIFVDNGLLRLHEATIIEKTFQNHFSMNLVKIDAKDRFLAALKNVHDPEQKRKIIGELFIRIFEEEAKKMNKIKWLAQGTIYPDVIESASAHSNKAHTIKTHHNVGGLPKNMSFQLLEPLRELFKDEVRKIGLALGLPDELVYRHPFPGPGIAVRILGEVRPEYCKILRQADAIFIEELRKSNWYNKVSQAFAVFLPIKSVGIVGDARQYEYVIALRAVETKDFMTATWARLPLDLLEHVSNRIANEVPNVTRVVYDISNKPPATIEWE